MPPVTLSPTPATPHRPDAKTASTPRLGGLEGACGGYPCPLALVRRGTRFIERLVAPSRTALILALAGWVDQFGARQSWFSPGLTAWRSLIAARTVGAAGRCDGLGLAVGLAFSAHGLRHAEIPRLGMIGTRGWLGWYRSHNLVLSLKLAGRTMYLALSYFPSGFIVPWRGGFG
jgi:hypothetical protein